MTTILFILIILNMIINIVIYLNYFLHINLFSFIKKKPSNNIIEKEEPKNIIHLSRESISLTSDLLDFIDKLILHESLYQMYQVASIGTKYDIRKLDNDIDAVAKRVYNGLNPSVMNESIVMHSESLMKYIVEKTTYSFTNTINEYNTTH